MSAPKSRWRKWRRRLALLVELEPVLFLYVGLFIGVVLAVIAVIEAM